MMKEARNYLLKH